MNMVKRKILQNVAKELFLTAKGLGQLAEEIVLTPYGQLRIHSMPKSSYYSRLNRYKRHGLIKKSNTKSGDAYVLTPKALRLKRSLSVKIPRTDGLSTIVIFDIPEDKHKIRDIFRRYLVNNGFTQIQKSVFLCRNQKDKEILEMIAELGIVDNVTFISGKLDQK